MDRRRAGPRGRMGADDDLTVLCITCDESSLSHEEIADEIGSAVISRGNSLFAFIPSDTPNRDAVVASVQAKAERIRIGAVSQLPVGKSNANAARHAASPPGHRHPVAMDDSDVDSDTAPVVGPIFPVDILPNNEDVSAERANRG